MDTLKIISFNVGTTHLMHFNKRLLSPFGETDKDRKKRSDKIKFEILNKVNKENIDFVCIQEGFDEIFPKSKKISHLTEVSKYEIKHGFIANFKSSYLCTYANLKKFDVKENGHFNKQYQKINFNQKNGKGYPCRTQIFDIKNKQTNENFTLVNFHGIGSPSFEIREPILKFLKDYLNTYYFKKDVILIGDINTNLNLKKGIKGEINFSKYVKNNLFEGFEVFPKDDKKKSSYHRFIRNDDMTFTDKPKSDRYDCLDYCLVKSHKKHKVTVERLPKGFKKMEVPYKLNSKTDTLEPNFNDFPSDHTLNIYTIKIKPGYISAGKSRKPIKQSRKGKSVGNTPESLTLSEYYPEFSYSSTKNSTKKSNSKSLYRKSKKKSV